MNTVIELVRTAGAPGYLIVFGGCVAGLAAFGAGLHLLWQRGARVARIYLGVLGLLLLVLILASVGGWAYGMSNMEEVLPLVDAAQRETIRMSGSAEAKSCLILGAAAALWPAFGTGLAAGRARLGGSGPSFGGGIFLGLGFALMVLGGGAEAWNRARGEQAIVHVDPAQAATIRSYMAAEAGRRLVIGGFAGGICLILGAGLVLRASRDG